MLCKGIVYPTENFFYPNMLKIYLMLQDIK